MLGIVKRQGAFAQYLVLPLQNLVAVPDHVPDRAAVFTEPLAAAFEILEQRHIDPSAVVAVLGDGKLGCLVALTLRLVCHDVSLVGRHPERREWIESLGVRFLGPDDTESQRFDVVVEASSSPDGWHAAVRMTRPRGLLILKSTYARDLTFNPAPLVINEIELVGSRCGPFAPALSALSRGLIDPTPLIAAEYPLAEYAAAFKTAAQRGMLKVLLSF